MPTPTPLTWQSDPTVRAHQRRSVAVLFIAQALGGLAVGAAASMGSLVAYEVTSNEALGGIVRVASAAGAALFASPMAWLAVQRGRRAALGAGWGVALLGAAVTLAALSLHDLLLLILGTLAFSAGSAANLQMRFAATDMELPERRGRTIAFVVWAALLGSVGAPLLAAPAAVPARRLGLPDIAGIYLFAGVGLLVTTAFVLLALRPDPMRVAQEHGESARGARLTGGGRILPALWRIPAARLTLVAACANQVVMTAVMVLTPVHMKHEGHGLTAVGFTLSMHILGMFGFSPLVGWLSDRLLGEVRTILVSVGIHLTALTCCFTAGHDQALLNLGLFLLGLGWSFGSVSASTLMVAAAPADLRARAQGRLDAVTNIGAAAAASLAGPVMAGWQYEGLSLVAALALVPTTLLAVRALDGDGPGSAPRRAPVGA